MKTPPLVPSIQEAEYFYSLPAAIRLEVGRWKEIVEFIGSHKSTLDGIRGAAEKWGHLGAFSEATISRKYYAFKRSGDWRVFINRSKMPKRTSARNILHIFRDYALKNNRSSREGWRLMMLDFQSGTYFSDVGNWTAVWAEQNPFDPVPENYPAGWVPYGWSYRNLQKLAEPTAYERTLARIGRAAARDYLPPVLTTRVGVKVGQVVMMDDLWHDCIINSIGSNRKGQREIEFCAIDVASGHKFAYGLQPRFEDHATGRMRNVPETRALELLAYMLCYKGYHPDGCRIIAEHGTARIPEIVQKHIKALSGDAIEVTAGGILSKPMHNGLYPGAGRGNFKLKAALESSHSTYHSIAAHLPGQLGMDPDHAPEEHGKLAKHNEHLITCYHELKRRSPERAAMLAFDIVSHNEYLQAINELYRIVAERTDHNLEGWESAGNIVSEFRPSASFSDWIPLAKIEAFPPNEQAAIRALIRSDPHTYTRTRKLSRIEVYNRGKDDLKTFSRFAMPHILGPDLGFRKTVGDDGMLSFRNKDFGPDEYHYYARQMLAIDGFTTSLSERREYIVHANPFNLDEIFISDTDSGAVLGILPRYGVPTKTDIEAIHRKIGKQAAEEARLMQPIIQLDSQRKRMETRSKNLQRNISVLRGDAVTEDEVAREERDLNTRISDEEREAVLVPLPERREEFSEDDIAAMLENEDGGEEPDYSDLI